MKERRENGRQQPADIQRLRRGTKRNFLLFAGKLLPEVTGKGRDTWKNHMFVSRVSENPPGWGDPKERGDCVSISDEALVLFLYENCLEKWKNKRERGWVKGTKKTEKEDGKYSTVSRKSQHRSGWKPGAMDRFTELYKLVEEDRKAECASEMEKWFLKKMRKTDKGKEYLAKLEGKNGKNKNDGKASTKRDGPVANDLHRMFG